MKLSTMLVALATCVLLASCTSSQPTPTPAGTTPPTSTPTPAEGALTPGFDQQPDGEVIPDSALSPVDISKLLRVPATDVGTPTSCNPTDVSAMVDNLDAAAGHRYGRLVLTNTSGRTCSVTGYLGIGARGEWGNTLQLAAEQREPRDDKVTSRPITLSPGATAFANLEWTGELAGAESEHISMLAIQLARSQDAFGIPAVGAVAADSGAQSGDSAPLDIGMLTTVRIGPAQSASP